MSLLSSEYESKIILFNMEDIIDLNFTIYKLLILLFHFVFVTSIEFRDFSFGVL